tara:strand:+ start:157 stop:690 length:534 start_codon:yes stop_codon:yes gene_type:complete
MEELWEDVVGFEGLYEVNTEGDVISMWNDRFRTPQLDIYGYHFMLLCKNGKYKQMKVHRLVAMAFIDNPENKPTVNHINGIKTDNRLCNLEWATLSENLQHSYDHLGRSGPTKGVFGKNHHRSKPVNAFSKAGQWVGSFESITDASNNTGVGHSGICASCRGRQRLSGGYVWRYANP